MSITAYAIAVTLSAIACCITYVFAKYGERERCTWLAENARRNLHNGSPEFRLGQLVDEIKGGKPTLADTQLYEKNRQAGY